MSEHCRFLVDSDEAYTVEENPRRLTPTEPVKLCAWADSRPDLLTNAPRWVQRNMLDGHLLRYPADCENCPARQS